MVRQVGVKNENHNDRAIIEMTHHTWLDLLIETVGTGYEDISVDKKGVTRARIWSYALAWRCFSALVRDFRCFLLSQLVNWCVNLRGELSGGRPILGRLGLSNSISRVRISRAVFTQLGFWQCLTWRSDVIHSWSQMRHGIHLHSSRFLSTKDRISLGLRPIVRATSKISHPIRSNVTTKCLFSTDSWTLRDAVLGYIVTLICFHILDTRNRLEPHKGAACFAVNPAAFARHKKEQRSFPDKGLG